MSPQLSGVTAVETHSAALFFFGDRVYKAKKPLDLGFVDFRSVASRADACRREVELNRRLAPDVYLGVATVDDPDGEICDHLVVMRRLPSERRLRRCLERGEDVTPAIRRVAHDIASLHAASPTAGPMDHVASSAMVRRRWTEGFDQMRSQLDDRTRSDVQTQIEQLALRFIDGRERLFVDRIRSGTVRDGHGDLQAEDIFVLDDGPRVLDCLEFDDDLRWGDVLVDVAFLAMDLERLGRPDLAQFFLDEYRHRSGSSWPLSLEHHYIAYRAHVRAKVGLIREVQSGERRADVDDLQELCLRHLEAGRVRLVLVGGLPGTGKTTVARGLADQVGAVLVRSDELRRSLPESRRYDPAATDAVYAQMLHRAADLLARGEQVVLDATWADASHRALARAAAGEVAADVVEIECEVSAEVARERIRTRLEDGSDLSEATPEVADRMAERFAPWPEAMSISTGGSPAAAERAARSAFG